MSFLLCVALINGVAVANLWINNANDFVQFSNNVNGENDYERETVYLNSDIDLSWNSFTVIGYDNYFSGTFDGQGHVIKNLNINSYTEEVGLFGYSNGLTIKNVVLDSSCSIVSTYNSYSYVGGIMARCCSSDKACVIENSVNMGSVSFSGSTDVYLYLGGIAGEITSYDYSSTVKNCANYGPVTHQGASGIPYIGGIVGDFYGESSMRIYIQNCLNYGKLTSSASTSDPERIGGISGSLSYANVDVCVSTGMITTKFSSNYVGGIVGRVDYDSYVYYCFWTRDVGYSSYYGYGYSSVSNTGSSRVDTLSSSTLSNLNTNRNSAWNKWFTVYLNGGTINEVNQNTPLVMHKYFPYPEKEGNTFDGWYTDSGCTSQYNPQGVDINSLSGVYAKWTPITYTITFDSRGGTSCGSISKGYGTDITLPVPNRDRYDFVYWCTDSDATIKFTKTTMPLGGATLYARWSKKRYTVSLYPNGGSCSSSITREWGDALNLPKPTRTGYSFVYWCSDSGLNTKYTGTVMPEYNFGLYAKWVINNYTLTFVFDNGGNNEARTLEYNALIVYPDGFSKTGYTFDKWDKELGTMPAGDTTITALWTPNNYTVTFNGTPGVPSLPNKSVTYDRAYGELPNATRTGYTLTGWFTDGGEKIEPTTKVEFIGTQVLYGQWVINKYTLTFDFDNGEENNESTLDFNEDIDYPDNFSKTGYTFDKWDKEPKTMPANDITITALWTPNEYTVVFDPTGGDVSPTSKNVTYDSIYKSLPEPTKTGYRFDGWFTEDGNEVINETEVNIIDTQKLYAKWAINNYTLTFDFDNGEENNESTLDFNEDIDYPDNFSKTGYTFDKWDKEPKTMPANDTTITALWTPNEYTVTFDPTGGDVSPASKKVTYDSTYGILPTPNMTGYAFNGWFTEDGDGVTKETEVNITEDQILYAYWIAGAITVTFDPTGGISDQQSKTTFFDETYGDLPEPTRTGYNFSGWFTGEGEEITSVITVKNPNHHTLYAHWAINQYTITFVENGGDECGPITQDYNTNLVLPKPAKTGYTFLCWCSDPDATIKYAEDTMPAENIELYAKWAINKYILTFNFDNGTEPEEETLDFEEVIDYPGNVSKTGYTFVDWDKDAYKMPPNNLNITALWEPNEYTVAFNPMGGDALSEPESSKKVTYDDEYGELPGVNRIGYSLAGWFTEEGVKIESTSTVKIVEDKTFYAKWVINNYTLTFVLNNGDGTEEEILEFDESIVYPNGIKRTGYAFDKWDKEPKRMPADNLTITAQWIPNNYSVVFNVNNGDPLSDPSIIATYDSSYGSLPEPTRTGYGFGGWFTEEEGGEEIRSEVTVKITSEQTLYAHWTAKTYVVSFDVNGGNTLNELTKQVTYDALYGELPEASREGHTFIGWTEETTANEVNSTDIVKVPNDHTLHAIWAVNRYNITFVFENGTAMSFILPFNTTIVYPNDVPSKSFYSFRNWCAKEETLIDTCDLTKVPARNLTFTPSYGVDSSLVTGTTVAATAGILFIILIIVVVLLVISLIGIKRKEEFVELDELGKYGRDDELIEERILQQTKATNISNNLQERIAEHLMKADKSKPLDEVLADLLEADCDEVNNSPVESFRTTTASAAVAGAIKSEAKMALAAEFLTLLYAAVREQEEYEEFEELYFGMKDINDFMGRGGDETICFGGIVSGFTNKKRAIQSLFSGDKKNNALSGVLFKVRNAKGYRIGELDDETDEILFELGSVFKVESVREVTENEFVSVNLSFISPSSKGGIIKL